MTQLITLSQTIMHTDEKGAVGSRSGLWDSSYSALSPISHLLRGPSLGSDRGEGDGT